MGVRKLHLNRRGNSFFAKNLLAFIENKWISESKGDITVSLEDVSNVSTLDAKQVLRGIRKTNINKLAFGQLNINSLRNKFDMLSETIKGFVDVFMISETKLDDSFPGGQFFIEGYHTPFRFDQNGNGWGVLREDTPAKIIHCDFPTSESFYVEIRLHKKKWLLNCSYNPYKNNICNYLDVVTKTLDTYYGKYKNVVFLGDLNAGTEEIPMKSFCESFNLPRLVKQPTCFKSPEQSSCIDLMFTKKPKSFQIRVL